MIRRCRPTTTTSTDRYYRLSMSALTLGWSNGSLVGSITMLLPLTSIPSFSASSTILCLVSITPRSEVGLIYLRYPILDRATRRKVLALGHCTSVPLRDQIWPNQVRTEVTLQSFLCLNSFEVYERRMPHCIQHRIQYTIPVMLVLAPRLFRPRHSAHHHHCCIHAARGNAVADILR